MAGIDDSVRRANNGRSQRIHYRYPLRAGSAGVLAAIRGDPDARDDITASRPVRNRANDIHAGIRAAIIYRCWEIEVPGRAALHRFIRRAGQNWRSGVHVGDALAAQIRVAAAILGNPDACEDLRARATVGERAQDRDAGQATIVRRSRRIEGPGAAAFNGAIGRAEGEHRRPRVRVGDRLAA